LKRWLKRIAVTVAALLIVTVLAVSLVKCRADAAFYEYAPDAPLNAVVRTDEAGPEFHKIDLVFDGYPGESVPTWMLLPPNVVEPVPCVIFLHGIGQKKNFIEEIAAPFTRAGFAMVSFDQLTRGERKRNDLGPAAAMLEFRRRAAATVIETRRLITYLETRGDIDASRIYLLGASYGAITGATAAASDTRVKATVLTYGGGDVRTLLRSDAAYDELGRYTGLVADLTAWLIAPADPAKHVGGIAPRPLLIQNGDHDVLIPTAAARVLQDAAGEPKDIIWYDSDHVGLDEANTREVLNDALEWIKARDAEIVGGLTVDASAHTG
jgi:uncharacterized protein